MRRAWRCTRCIDEHHAEYDDIVPRPGQIQDHGDQYCKKPVQQGVLPLRGATGEGFFTI